MKFIDDKTNKLSWWNRNYFYIGTFLVIAINILLYAVVGSKFNEKFLVSQAEWNSFLNFDNLIRAFVNGYAHLSWMHLLGNMLFFLIVGTYLERKMGSINFSLLVFGGSVISAMAIAGNHQNLQYAGFSGVVFFLFAVTFVDAIFNLQKENRTKINIIYGYLTLTFMFILACLGYENNKITFKFLQQLTNNMGHYSAFLAGLTVGFVIYIAKFKVSKQMVPATEIEVSKKAKFIVYSIVSVLLVAIIATSATLAGIAYKRTTLSLNIYDTAQNYSKKYQFDSKNNGYLNSCLDDYVTVIEQEEQERDKYIFEIYTDKDFKYPQNTVWKLYTDEFSEEPLYPKDEDHIPLKDKSKVNYYIKSYKGYGIHFENYTDFCKGKEEDSKLFAKNKRPANISHYITFQAWDFVPDGGEYKFKLNNLKKDVKLENIKVQYTMGSSNATELTVDENGYFTISNVTNDLNIILQEK